MGDAAYSSMGGDRRGHPRADRGRAGAYASDRRGRRRPTLQPEPRSTDQRRDDVPARWRESKWFYHQRTGTFELVGSEGTIVTFDDPQEIDEDTSVYPRAESEITDFDQWTKIKRPLVPSLAFDVEMGEAPDPAMYDVVRVPTSSDDRGLEIVESDGTTPLSELRERENDRDRRDRSSGPLPEF